MSQEEKTALILTIGLATEPSIKRINSLEHDLVYLFNLKGLGNQYNSFLNSFE